jgi:hypothetical protein
METGFLRTQKVSSSVSLLELSFFLYLRMNIVAEDAMEREGPY